MRDELNDVRAEGVHLGVELDAGNAVAKINQGCAGILLNHAVGFFCHRHRPNAPRDFNRFPVPSSQFPVGAAGGSLRVVFVPGLLTRREESLDIRGDGTAFFSHALNGSFNTSGVPQFKRTEFPVETKAHGAVDFDN